MMRRSPHFLFYTWFDCSFLVSIWFGGQTCLHTSFSLIFSLNFGKLTPQMFRQQFSDYFDTEEHKIRNIDLLKSDNLYPITRTKDTHFQYTAHWFGINVHELWKIRNCIRWVLLLQTLVNPQLQFSLFWLGRFLHNPVTGRRFNHSSCRWQCGVSKHIYLFQSTEV